MKNWFEKYFGFSQREIKGLCVLFLVMGMLFVFPIVFSWIKPDEQELITEEVEREIYEFLYATQSSDNENAANHSASASQLKIEYFEFNPNNLNLEEGLQLGLGERQIQMIQNYVSKGGSFYRKEDFKKIYAISEKDYERLAPYISIPAVQNSRSSSFIPANRIQTELIKKEEPQEYLLIELNSTDSIELQNLRGIGPVFASRIVRYRDNLGGFHDVAQLLSVYGMDEERFQGIVNHVYINPLLIKKLAINQADYEQLRKHSLISTKQANSIVHYRKQHGKFNSVEDLLKIALIDEDFLLKIAPYLTVSND